MQSPQTSTAPLTSDAKSLDTIRRSLLSLTHTLQSLHRDLAAPTNPSTPLPPWTSLQNSFTLLSHNLSALTTHMDASRDLLHTAHAYPLPSFPGREHEALLAQLLLRKRGDVGVEEWVGAAAARADAVGANEAGWLDKSELAALWDWALPCAGDAAQKVPFGIDLTVAEREAEGGAEAVRRREGLTRELTVKSATEEEKEEEDDDEEEDEEEESEEERAGEKMEVDKPAVKEAEKPAPVKRPPEIPMVPLEDILKFMTTGAEPRQ